MRIVPFFGVFILFGIVSSAVAGEYRQTPNPCYWCVRDAIYEDVTLIDRLEANPDVDEGVKGPAIVAARADIHRLRATLDPLRQDGATPCCYARKPLYIRRPMVSETVVCLERANAPYPGEGASNRRGSSRCRVRSDHCPSRSRYK